VKGGEPCGGNYLAYCNAYPDLQNAFCGGAECTTDAHAASCKNHWGPHSINRTKCNPEGFCSTDAHAESCIHHWHDHGQSEGRLQCAAAAAGTTQSGDVCDLKYAFSPAPMSTSIECDCKSCTFRPTDAAESKFESDCEKCDCVQQASSQCMDSQGTPNDQRVFSTEDRHYLMTWGLAGDFFEGPYCHYAGCHPRTTCKKLRCEAFGSKEDSDCYSLNKDEWALEQMLGNASADMNHPGLQDPNLGEWRDDFSWVNARKRTDPFDPDQNFCKALKSLMMSHVFFETGFVPFSDKKETAEADVKLESDQDFQKFDSWTKNPQFKHRSHCVNQYWSETYAEDEPEVETGPQPTSLLQNRANVMDKIRGHMGSVHDVADMMLGKNRHHSRSKRRGRRGGRGWI